MSDKNDEERLEPVYQYRELGDEWVRTSEEAFYHAFKNGNYELRKIYTNKENK